MSEKFKLPKLITDLLDFEALTARAQLDPLGLVEHCRRRTKEYDEGVRWLHWCVLMCLYEAARFIIKDEMLIIELLRLPYFADRTYQPNKKEILRLVLLAGLNPPPSGKTYKKVCHEALLLKPFFKDDIESSTLLSMIMAAGGLKGLAEHFLAEDAGKVSQVERNDPRSNALTTADHKKRVDLSELVEKTLIVPEPQQSIEDTSIEDEMYLLEVLMTRKRLDRLVHAAEGSTGFIMFEKHEGDPEARMLIATSVKIHK